MSEQVIEYFPAGPTIARFHQSEAPVRCIRGPVGSGKTTGCCIEVIRRAQEQAAGPDGIRRSRWAIIRNTAPQLTTTTLRTFQELVPATHAKVSMDSPITVRLQSGGLDAEFLFLALDNEQDVRKLLSLELTGAFVNEAREVPLAVIDQLTARVGRYPSARLGGATWSGIVMDSNAPDAQSWWYRFAEVEHPPGWEFFTQPSGLAPDAENLQNLNQNAQSLKLAANDPARLLKGRQYYERISSGKSVDWVKIYVNGEYGFSLDGKPVFPEYSDSVHTAQVVLDALPNAPVIAGVDFGLAGSACVFLQRDARGRYLLVHEIVAENAGVETFARLLMLEFAEAFPGNEVQIYCDPAAGQRSQLDERTALQFLKGLGLPAKPAPTNDILLRLEAVRRVLSRLVEGKPGLIVCPNCTHVRKSLAGGYRYRRIHVSGTEKFADVPEKDEHSHIADALQYALLGAGEGRLPKAPNAKRYEFSLM